MSKAGRLGRLILRKMSLWLCGVSFSFFRFGLLCVFLWGTEVNNVIIILEYCVVFSQTISLSCAASRGCGATTASRKGQWGMGKSDWREAVVPLGALW